MPVVISPESELGQELAKWNKPYHFEPFPMMLYRARKRPDGVVSVLETNDGVLGGQPGTAETFTTSCQLTVNDETELTRALEMGWCHSPTDAMDSFAEKEKFLSTAAAHRAHEDRNMGEGAKAEAAAADASTPEHIAEVPRKRARRGRPRKKAS